MAFLRRAEARSVGFGDMDNFYLNRFDTLVDTNLEDAMEALLRYNLAVMPDLSESSLKRLLTSLPGRTVASLVYLQNPDTTRRKSWSGIRDYRKVPAQWAALTGTVGLIQASNQTAFESSNIPPRDQTKTKAVNSGTNSHESASSSPTWPLKEGSPTLPDELVDMILSYLSRDDLKALRLTCQTLRAQVSDKFFKSVVVPFNAGIYGMLPIPRPAGGTQVSSFSIGSLGDIESLLCKGKADPNIYSNHELDVFETFGHHVKKFGMSYTVDEGNNRRIISIMTLVNVFPDDLSSIPSKGLYQHVRAYWGEYEWPVPGYQRFTEIASVENIADETLTMKIAFSQLRGIQELALSIDNGLGWLHGPDISLHSQIFKGPSQVFGQNYCVPDRRTQARLDFWGMLKRLSPDTFAAFESPNSFLPDLITRHYPLDISKSSFTDLIRNNITQRLCITNSHYLDVSNVVGCAGARTQLHQLVDMPRAIITESPDNSECSQGSNLLTGIVTIQDSGSSGTERETSITLKPNSLTVSQMEWLLETKWAQQALISSYVIAVMDNQESFQYVHTMNLSGISCQYLTPLTRSDFWDSLPKLKKVTVLALAEWREVIKDSALSVTSTNREPLKSCIPLERICSLLATMENITTLNIGWASGGERETGFYGRNQHLMPAPIMNSMWIREGMLEFDQLAVASFPFVKDLTLTNCWVAPTPLLLFMKQHSETLHHITLDSVSITRQPQNLPWIAQEISQDRPTEYDGQPQQLQPRIPEDQIAIFRNPLRMAIPQIGNATALPIPVPNPQRIPWRRANTQPTQRRWAGSHRPGSWPWVLEAISPVSPASRSRSGQRYQRATASVLGPASTLKSLKLKSCGYAKLSIPHIEQSNLSLSSPHSGSAHWSRVRHFAKHMFGGGSFEPAYGLGTIAQCIETKERRALETVWGCSFGPWQIESEACAMDGWHKYGTGRFTGDIGHN
jgi:F-box domain